ncbi:MULTISPECIES: hypothetical protein [Alcaligenes]|uniref:hypothetical protein n=1 Tax=Alcaligenes TaxID=507 RepID=UPI002AA68A25|nr:hypothetical protein [Alcaligenes phenolicus]
MNLADWNYYVTLFFFLLILIIFIIGLILAIKEYNREHKPMRVVKTARPASTPSDESGDTAPQ